PVGLVGAVPGAARQVAVGGQAGGSGDPATAGQEPPLVHVLDQVLVGGQPGARAGDVLVEAAREQHSARVHGVPTAAVKGHKPSQHLAGGQGETDPVQAVPGQPGDL